LAAIANAFFRGIRARFGFSPRYRRGAGVRCSIPRVQRHRPVTEGHLRSRRELDELEPPQETDVMAKGQQRSNREAKKPKKDKTKVIAAAPSRKEAAWQPDFGPAKKK
jgi:hypothetical protein